MLFFLCVCKYNNSTDYLGGLGAGFDASPLALKKIPTAKKGSITVQSMSNHNFEETDHAQLKGEISHDEKSDGNFKNNNRESLG